MQYPIICGPTASGKTSVVYHLSEMFDIELVSVDSRQIYKYLDIGTGKPNQADREKVVHHLIDIIEPGVRYSSYQFLLDADRIIGDIIRRGKVPILVGGTGFYMTALIDGVVRIEQEDKAIRLRLEQELMEKGSGHLHQRLEQIDPEDAKVVHPNNYVRLIRALEIYELTGKTRTELKRENKQECSQYKFMCYALLPERDWLYRTINMRVDQMIEDGWVDEVKELVESGWELKIRRSNVIGYSELIDHLKGAVSLESVIESIKQNTRQYAKRQYTWFRNQLEAEAYSNAEALIEAVSFCIRNVS